jgi:hypothetical protein
MAVRSWERGEGRPTMTELRRLILEFKPDGHELRVLYRTTTRANPGTDRRRREVEQLVRTGLERALEALREGPAEMVGTAGFTTREDSLFLVADQTIAGRKEESSS